MRLRLAAPLQHPTSRVLGMAHHSERKGVPAPTAPAPGTAAAQLEAMRAYARQVTSSREAAAEFLRGAGVLDKQGRLAKPYRP
jgi:hypothetical protein